jgi:hypothetical protein
VLDRTLAYRGELGPYYGGYQLYLLTALLSRLFPAWGLDRLMLDQLIGAEVYGFFSMAWGGMFLDFGIAGALLAIFICGAAAQYFFDRAVINRDPPAQLISSYVLAGIIATPILSMFTISISLPILFSIVVASWFLKEARPGQHRVSGRKAPFTDRPATVER